MGKKCLDEKPLARQAVEDSGETPEKKLCLPSDGASTSDYSIGDQIDVDLDETPFTTVAYRKKRSKGIPIVFKSTKAQSFWKVNPNRIANEIVTTAQEKEVRPVYPSPLNPMQKRSRYTYAEAIGAAGPGALPQEPPPAPPPPPIRPRLLPRIPPRKSAIRDSTADAYASDSKKS
ncbi:hypothetical protein HPB47_020200 [Ixodes persulcatus]|uniref:Uncharacterized protein n=1 Tax=Ixodes persulcatus TaxID=34615 RepID=A0AC60QI28_IXOPE|nr:hypothetical protein HPB47_020200 [Ixodes persulcatus]